jgi:hypothetical protein
VLATLDSQIDTISKQTEINKKQKEDYENYVLNVMKEVNDKKEANSGNSYPTSGLRRVLGPTSLSDRMDVDEPDPSQNPTTGGSKGKNRK